MSDSDTPDSQKGSSEAWSYSPAAARAEFSGRKRQKNVRGVVRALFSEVDTNQDGMISSEEWDEFFQSAAAEQRLEKLIIDLGAGGSRALCHSTVEGLKARQLFWYQGPYVSAAAVAVDEILQRGFEEGGGGHAHSALTRGEVAMHIPDGTIGKARPVMDQAKAYVKLARATFKKYDERNIGALNVVEAKAFLAEMLNHYRDPAPLCETYFEDLMEDVSEVSLTVLAGVIAHAYFEECHAQHAVRHKSQPDP